jgi:nucleoside-diphosphate-sugar epimerase
MKVLVLGGSGFLSGTLARVALAAGHQVTVLTRGQRPVPPGLRALVADRNNPAAFDAALTAAADDWDLLVDCIGFDETHAAQTAALGRRRARHTVFISTDFVIASDGRTLPQAADGAPLRDDDSYGGRKRRAEEIFRAQPGGWRDWTILRPGHIYGPGSLLGCLPRHGRQPDLIERIRSGTTLELVGGGRFLQQPVLARDLAGTILACARAPASRGETFMVPGPEVLESRRYYEAIGQLLGAPVAIAEVSVPAHRAAHPEHDPFLCHRVYDREKLPRHGLPAPATPFLTGLREHLAALGALASP